MRLPTGSALVAVFWCDHALWSIGHSVRVFAGSGVDASSWAVCMRLLLPFKTYHHVLIAVNTSAHRTGSPVCGTQPGKEPLAYVDRAVLIAVQHEAAVPTAIRALPERHGLLVPTAAAGLARLAFI